jgi:hypothetical protein
MRYHYGLGVGHTYTCRKSEASVGSSELEECQSLDSEEYLVNTSDEVSSVPLGAQQPVRTTQSDIEESDSSSCSVDDWDEDDWEDDADTDISNDEVFLAMDEMYD